MNKIKSVTIKKRDAIFYQPEKLTPKRARSLIKFLKAYPELNSYRELTLTIGSIYCLPLNLIHKNIIDDLIPKKEWGAELQACIKTFKRKMADIFRFVDFFKQNPDLPKRCRANMEYQNRPVKQIFKTGNNLKCMDRIENELCLHLGGQVRNLLEV